MSWRKVLGAENRARVAYFILESEKSSDGQYIPLIAKEGESGYYRTDWFWGVDKKEAQEVCDLKNSRLGLTPEDVNSIVKSTMKSLKWQRHELN